MCELRNSVVYMHVETCTHVGMFFSLKRKGNPVTCDNMDETIGYCPKGISQTKTNSSWYHFYVEIKKKKKKQTPRNSRKWLPGYRGNRKSLVKG